MMTRDVMAGPVCEMHEVANKVGRAEKALAELPEKQVVAMKAYHDTVAARISHQTGGGTYGAEF